MRRPGDTTSLHTEADVAGGKPHDADPVDDGASGDGDSSLALSFNNPAANRARQLGGDGAPTARPAVTVHRYNNLRTRLDLTENILWQSADKGFVPQYVKRIQEMRRMFNAEYVDPVAGPLTPAHLQQGIDALRPLLQQLQDLELKYQTNPDSLTEKELQILNLNTTLPIMYQQILPQVHPELAAFVANLVLRQFGKGEIDLGRVSANMVSRNNIWTGNAYDPFGIKEIQMAMESMATAQFFSNIDVKQDGKKFSITFINDHHDRSQDTTLVNGEVDTHRKVVKFSLDPNCPPQLLDTALITMADMVSSHRQLRNNVIKITNAGDAEALIRYCELLLCKHRMNIDLSDVKGYMNLEMRNPQYSDALRARWEFIKEFAEVHSTKTQSKLSEKEKRPDLQKYGFSPEQFETSYMKGTALYESCLAYLFKQALNDATPYGGTVTPVPSSFARSTSPALARPESTGGRLTMS